MRPNTLLILLLVFPLLVLGQTQPTDSTAAQRHFDMAVAYKNKGFYREALRELEEAHLQFEWQSEQAQVAHLEAAACYAELMRWDSATLITQFYLGEMCALSLPVCAKANQTMGAILLSKGDYEGALPYFQKSLDLYHEYINDESPETAGVYMSMGDCYSYMFLLDKALYYYQESESALLRYSDFKDIQFVKLYNDFADIYTKQGEEDKSRRWLQKSLELLQAFHSETHPEAVGIYYSLGLATKSPEQALGYFEQSLRLNKDILQGRHISAGLSLTNIGNYYHAKGDALAADKYYREALAYYQQTQRGKHPDICYVYDDLGLLYAGIDFEKSLQYFNQAILAAVPNGLPNSSSPYQLPPDLMQQYIGQGYVHIISSIISKNGVLKAQYQTSKKPDFLRHITEHCQTARTLVHQALSRPLSYQEVQFVGSMVSLLYQQAVEAYQLLHSQEPETGHLKNAFVYADENKTIKLKMDFNAQQLVRYGELSDSLKQQEDLLFRSQNIAEKEWLMAQQQGWKDYEQNASNAFLKAQKEYNALVADLQQSYPRYHQFRYNFHSTNVEEVQKALGEEKLLVEYYIGDKKLYIFSVSANRLACRVLPLTDSTDKAIKQYQQALRNPKQEVNDFAQAAHFLYRQLLQPELEGSSYKHLVVIGEQTLAQIPFEPLLHSPPAANNSGYSGLDYLVRHLSIKYSYSAAMLLVNRKKQRVFDARTIMAMSANYDSSVWERVPTPELLEQRKQMLPLPRAEAEVMHLKREYYGLFLYNDLCTETAFKSAELDMYSVLHIATHAQSNQESPLESALYFTEDGDATEDDILYAHEITQFHIPANLVVLSVCGAGNSDWEAAVGSRNLAQAFMYAGAASVIASFWEVNDAATLRIMEAFYNNLHIKYSKSEALQLAKLDYLEKAQGIEAHPFYWASFGLVGDDSPIRLHRQSEMGNEFLWGVAAAVILLSWLFIKGLRRLNKPIF